ncbi:hypothetical protein P3T76_013457 [Phytophthora citrophthora]|uniref:Uncharacterized protein n=1 Tax=Phytophthora citrophthora TaxID=4793 RepID=A0AAD9LC75_9STRA|nr:hypothetical protein P3T76_013457 [Phytophthora citrophthora]
MLELCPVQEETTIHLYVLSICLHSVPARLRDAQRNHEQLFHTEYKRSNRTKGLKILRCFPHCCPEHIGRSYCGTSLSVRVNLAPPSEENHPPADVSLIRLFARFESVSDVSLRPGECVEVDKIDATTQSETNPDGLWVGGILDKPSRLVASISTDSTNDDKSLVFHLNSRSYSKWYYDWESGANKAQRLMKHVLQAYVVQLCGVDKDDNFINFDSKDSVKQLYRVLHVESSPEFTVISYRRAPTDQYQSMYMEGGGVSLYEEISHHGESPVNSYDDGGYSQSRSDWGSVMEARPAPLYSKMHQAKRQRSPTPPPRRMEAGRIPDLLEDKLRWEYKNVSAVSVSRNLALVYSFLRWAPLSVYASFVDELVHGVNDSLLGSLEGSSLKVSRLNCFSKLLLNQARAGSGGPFVRGKQSGNRTPAVLPRGLETLLRALAESTLWLFSMETRQWMHGFFLKHASTVEDKYALRQCFVLFIQELQTRLEAQVFAQTTLVNLSNAAEEVIATVYSYEYFHAWRPQVRKILSGQSFAGWNAFVAQMREMYISKRLNSDASHKLVKRQTGLDFVSAHPPQNPVEYDWNAEWLLDVDEAVWQPSENAVDVDILDSGRVSSIDNDDESISLFTMLEIISQLARVEVAINVRERILYMRSTQGVAGPLDCMRLVLDGKDRLFSQFPNGFATGLDAGTYGDYIGEVKVEEPGLLVVCLELFNWCIRGNGPSYHVRMEIECWHDGRLCISGDILSSRVSFTPEEALYVGEMTLRDKREAVNAYYAEQQPVSAGPWKEFGRFRLNYVKV